MPSKRLEYNRRWRAENRDRVREHKRRYAAKRKRARRDTSQWGRVILPKLRERAKQKGLDFDLTADDIVVPERCPVLGYRLEPGSQNRDHRPSVDRIDNTKGYVRGNVRVISFRANTLKNSADLEEIRKVLAYVEGKC